MSNQDHDGPLAATAIERPHAAYAKLARACITLARLSLPQAKPPEDEVKRAPDGAAE